MSCLIRLFANEDAQAVQDLLIAVNRLLATSHLAERFEDYIALSLRDEIARIGDYYGECKGGFWVAECSDQVVGTFGLEAAGKGVMELRRMCVAPDFRRRGLARAMLEFAEAECQRRGIFRIGLSTSERQLAALELYRATGGTSSCVDANQ
jgi:putative acetyltransferase